MSEFPQTLVHALKVGVIRLQRGVLWQCQLTARAVLTYSTFSELEGIVGTGAVKMLESESRIDDANLVKGR